MVKFESILKKVNPRFGVYGVLGNHDGYGRGNVEEFLKNSGISLLKDSVAVIGNSFAIAGRHDNRVRDRLSVEMMVSYAPPNLPLIMVDHRPTELDQISKTRVDLSLSGHVHNGQLFPINFIMRKLYELSYGHLKKGNTHFFVTSGIRLWGPPVRTVGKSEILVVNVNFE
jgi:predicted MPP superfamily phosphohydrolase